MGSRKEQAATILNELIKDAEDRRDRVKGDDNFRDVRMDWLRRAYPRVEDIEALRILPTGSFGSFDNPNITDSLSEYYDDVAAVEETQKKFDSDNQMSERSANAVTGFRVMAAKKKSATKKAVEKAHCRTDYGSLVLWTEPSSKMEKCYWILVDDTKTFSRIHKLEATGTLAEAKQCAIALAKKHLRDKGEPSEFDPKWRCTDSPFRNKKRSSSIP